MAHGLALVDYTGNVLDRGFGPVNAALRAARSHLRRKGLTLAAAWQAFCTAQRGVPMRGMAREAAYAWTVAARIALRALQRARCCPPGGVRLALASW